MARRPHKKPASQRPKCDSMSAEKRLMSVCSEWFEIIGSPRSLTCWLLLKHGEYGQLVNLKIDPLHYLTAASFKDDYQATKLLSKYRGFKHPDLDPIKAAEVAYIESELSCFAQNKVFKDLASEQAAPQWLLRVRERIDRILGDFTVAEIMDVSFGPGGTIGVTRAESSPYIKMRGLVTTGPQLYDILRGRGENFASGLLLSRVDGNELSLVPKNAKTHRSIFKEPTLDAVIQRQIGLQIKKRLMRDGCDLRYQDRNQALAGLSPWSNPIATIDLKAASDTISYEVVRWLLPSRWFHAMDSVRSSHTRVRGVHSKFEKFSSMGNGYTFELETLIFWSVVKTTVPRAEWNRISVYGDDIIVPSRYSEALIERLRFLGFQTNVEKTYVSGPFRESCGHDFFNGVMVTPVYIKDPLNGTKEIVSLCNRIYAYADPSGNFGGVSHHPLKDLHARMVRWLHPRIGLNPVPRLFGDAGIWGPVHPGRGNVRFNRTLQSWEVRVRVQVPAKQEWDGGNPRVFLMSKLVTQGSVLNIETSQYYRLDGPVQTLSDDFVGEQFCTSNPRIRYTLKWCCVASLN